jgi:hypothetical protein
MVFGSKTVRRSPRFILFLVQLIPFLAQYYFYIGHSQTAYPLYQEPRHRRRALRHCKVVVLSL